MEVLADRHRVTAGLWRLRRGEQLTLVLNHKDGSKEEIKVNHTYNEQQIEWFKAGGALNVIRSEFAAKAMA